jgi:tetratricopeptide (TPR) repeat protein
MGGLSRLFRRKRAERAQAPGEAELARLLEEQTGDPAFMHRTKWITAYGKEDFATALDEVNRALQVSAGSALYLALRAMTHYQMGNYSEANADVSAALAADPSRKEALDVREALRLTAGESRDRARQLAKEGKESDAVDELATAIALEPENPFNFFFRGLTYARMGNLEAAVSDLTRTLELDPSYPEAQEMLQSVRAMAAESESASEPSEASEPSHAWHYFICSGNRSLIDAFRQLFRSGEAAGYGRFGRYYASNDDLDARRQEAAEAGLAFSGVRYSGTDSEPAEDLDRVLSSLSVQGPTGVHVATAVVPAAHRGWVEQVYTELLGQAMQQGIMPFPMFVTQSEDAALFLNDSLSTYG